MMVCLELHLILMLQMTALVGCITEQATKSAKLVYERHSKNFDYDDNYQITVTRGREIIDSTLTKDGHAREITVSISAFGSVFHLDLKLNTYLLAKNYVEKTINKDGDIFHDVKHNERHCFYLGTVREQPLSKAALSTCQGIVGYFSIGNVSYHIEQRSGRLNGDHKVYRRRNDAEAIIRKGHDQMSMASLLNKKKHNRRMRRSFEWPQDRDKENMVIEIYVANDRSEYLSQGSSSDAVFQQTKDIVNIASLGFQSLGIYLVLVGSEVWADSDRINVNASNATATTQEWTTYRMASINPSTPNDHGVLITNNTFENTTILGFAYISAMCSNRLSASLVSDVFKRPIVAAAAMDYGIGSNLGITSDTALGNCSCDDPSGYCIMNPSVSSALSSLTWSQCSKDQFGTLDTFGIDICLQNVPEFFSNLNASSTCGNGIVEHDEQCDCGNATDQECNKLCCDSMTCLLRSWATCAYGRCCDISTCQVLGCNTTCRQKTSDCDLVEFCNGISGLCPFDTHLPDGTDCVVNGVSAYCYSGLCQSRESQCEFLWGSDTLVSSDHCYNSLNNVGNIYGNCGINWLPNVTYVPCNSSDVFCGRLLCQDINKTLHHYFNCFKIAYAFNANDTCHSVIFDFGLATQDPGLVPSGAKCGVDKMCVNQKCVDVDTTSHCPSDCGPDEVCNNLGQCQKLTASCQNSTGPTGNGSDTTTFSRRETTPLYTTSKPTTPLVTTSKRDISSVMTSKPVVTTAGTLKYTTPFVIQPGPTTLSVTTRKSTTLDATTSKPVTPLIENSRATTRLISTLGPTTQKATTVINPTFLIETSMTTTGILSTLGPNRLLDTTTASKVATYDISFVSTALSSAPININECDSSPCLHMATCVDLVNDYKCFCASGFTGRNCETVFNPCDTLPCINGTCNNNTATCACIAGYRGPLCEEEIAECDSDPCQHDSKCVDGLNSYQCQCLGGYTGRNCETEMNECESSPCPNNFTCESSVNRYQCICPNPDEFIGIRCNIPVSPSEKSDSPEFIRASPNHGPMSGGTKITITGRNLDKYGGIFFLFIGNMKLPIKNWTRSWPEFLVVTTAGESSIVGQDQNLTFEITGGKNISSTLTFTYYPDPEIEDVKPIKQLASGGTTLTVIGNNLNSSASPYLQVILNTTTPGRLNKNITVFNGPTCDASSSTEIYCLMPRVNVVGTTIVNQPGSGLRKRRDSSTPNITTYLTLILRSDGAEDSSNKSVVLIAYRGVLDPVSGPMSFNPNDDPFIHIKGGMLSDGIVKDDYEISVGIGDCTNKTLNANELSCRPPIEEPDPGSDQALYCSETGGLPVIVYPGKKVDNDDRKQLHWACLIYPDSKFSWWIVGVICGGSALLLALTVVCFVVCRRWSKQQRGASKHRVHSMSRKSGKNIDHTKADWSKIQVNAQGEPSEEPRNMRNDIYTSRITDDIGLNDYHNDSSMRKFGPNDYDRTLITDLSKGSIYLDERGRQMTQYELDMIAAERNARDLRNPISARYSRGRLSGYYSRGAAPHDSSNYTNHKSDSEISAIQDWRNQGRRLRPTTQKQFGGDWNASDNAISVAPAYFLGQNRGLRSPMYGSLDLPTTGDYTGHKVGYRGQ